MEEKNAIIKTKNISTSFCKRKLQTPKSVFHPKLGKFVDLNQSLTPCLEHGTLKKEIFRSNISNSGDSGYGNCSSGDQLKNTLIESFAARTALKQNRTNIANSSDAIDSKESEWSVTEKSKFYKDVDCLEAMKHSSSLSIRDSTITSQKLVEYHPEKTVNFSQLTDIDWTNPVLGSIQQDIASVSSTKVLSRSNFDKIYSSFRFSKEMLINAVVLGQVDNKFIACRFQHGEEYVLVLIDQHAAHERIRLEKLLDQIGYYERDDGSAKNALKHGVCSLSPPAEILFTDNEIDMLLHYHTEFLNIGIRFSTCKSKLAKTAHGSMYRVIVSSVPSVFVNVCEPQAKAKGSSVNPNLLKEYLVEQSRFMRVCSSKCSIASPVIFKVLASYACHGAIRFGDALEKSVCVKLVRDLSKCQLPFQCAHGRPSVAPLLRLSMVTQFWKRSRLKTKPNLKNLASKMHR